ncbi:hypothetical protein ACP275_01G054000 [Erythranthe tilingii]
MEITALNPHAKAALFFHNISSAKHSRTPIQIQLPIHTRPEYKPIPKPARIKPIPKPITTTSDILHLMDSLKLPIPPDIYTSLIKECTELGDPLKSIELHEHMRRSRFRFTLPLLNRLLLMYVSSGCLDRARQLFDQMFLRDFNSWAVLIAGCVENGEHGEAINLFVEMLHRQDMGNVGLDRMGFSVSGILVCVLKACLFTSDFELGTQVHCWLWKMGFSKSASLSCFLINFYGRLDCFEGAQTVFDHVRNPNTAVWTSRIVSFCSNGNFEEAVSVFKEMGREGVRENGYTFSTVLKACRKMGDIRCGQQVHANSIKSGLESDGYVQCALVDFYGKCGFLNDATRVFEMDINKKNDASCNAMLANYVRHGLCIEANEILRRMKMSGSRPCESVFNEVSFVCGSGVTENDVDEKYL